MIVCGTFAATTAAPTTTQAPPTTATPASGVPAAGSSDSAGTLTSVELYNYSSGTWTAIAPLATGLKGFQAVLLPNGSVLVAGDVSTESAALASSRKVQRCTILQQAPGPPLATARSAFQMVMLSDGRVLAVGRSDADGHPLVQCDIAACPS